MSLLSMLKSFLKKNNEKTYINRFHKYSFFETKCSCYEQYEACVTRLYHTIEKGLSYEAYRPGFGKNNIESLLNVLDRYIASGYDQNAFFYETALSVLHAYVEKNKSCGYEDLSLEKRIKALPGKSNKFGGTISFSPLPLEKVQFLGFEEFIKNRHSIRHFSNEPVALESLKKAINLAQFTPSACNRQGWKTRIISSKNIIENTLKYQNGNKGFGQEFDKLLLVTADVRYFNEGRESFQAYIDGGMYAANVLNALHYERIGSVPLSASLTLQQERNVRKILNLDNAEILILFIGVGNYPKACTTTRSERRKAQIEIL